MILGSISIMFFRLVTIISYVYFPVSFHVIYYTVRSKLFSEGALYFSQNLMNLNKFSGLGMLIIANAPILLNGRSVNEKYDI